MVESIMLAAAIFWDSNFALCPGHYLNLTRKLEFKTKRLKVKRVNDRILQIRPNRTIAKLNLLFMNNSDWWCSRSVIFAEPKGKNVKYNKTYLL